jgi:predicted nucleotide-binding protein (sugar kinase/HSP70/actin superfamily)
MKITFPYMGSTVIYQKVLELLEHEVIMPPRPTQHTINLGVKYSPEFACFPYKVLLGSYIESLQLGADTILTSGGNGPCRAGFYNEVHRKTLLNLGYDVEMIVFDDIYRNPKLFMERLWKIKNHKSWIRVIKAIYTAYELAHAIDSLQKVMELKRPYELEPGSFSAVFEMMSQKFANEANTIKDIRRLKQEGMTLFHSIPVHEPSDNRKVRIGIVGEIYVVIESSINMGIAELLNKLGCEVTRSLYVSEWVDHSLPKFLGKSDATILKSGKQYMEIGIGGHEIHNIGHMVFYKNKGFDGVVHLMPFACLPELVTQSLIPKISADLAMPILTLAIDEQSGAANTLTRLEAFVELVKNHKQLTAG